jgi:diguanylate cyclase (GGDEF)-like protein
LSSLSFAIVWKQSVEGYGRHVPTSLLLSVSSLAPEQRWRLTASLWERGEPMLGSAAGLLAILCVCWLRTRWAGFAALGCIAVGLTSILLALRAAFHRAEARHNATPGQEERTPDRWAGAFAAGATATGLLWGAISFSVLMRGDDTRLQLLALLAQAAWLGGAAVRNAASPASVTGQVVGTALPAFTGLALLPPSFVDFAAVFLVLQIIATFAASQIVGARIATLMVSGQRLAGANAQLQRLSANDALTSIANRRGFDAALQVEWARAARESADLSLLLIDIDQFVAFNKLYRSLAGDDCLRVVAGHISDLMRRPADLAARFGGAMFAAILPGTSEAGARDVAERLRQTIETVAIPNTGSPLHVVTISVGVASMAPQPGSSSHMLTALADQALYDAKQAGGNRVRGATSRLPLADWHARPAPKAAPTTGIDTLHPDSAPIARVAIAEKPYPAIPPGLKVLVLEDDAMVSMLLEDMLEDMGCRVMGPFDDVAATMALIEREAPQVGLLDVHLGDGDEPYGVARVLAGRGVPFAFVTGDGAAKLPEEFNGRPILHKPFHLATMVKLVAQLAGACEA